MIGIDPATIVIAVCAILVGAFGLAFSGVVVAVLRARDRRRDRRIASDAMMQVQADHPGFTPEQYRHFERRLMGGPQ